MKTVMVVVVSALLIGSSAAAYAGRSGGGHSSGSHRSSGSGKAPTGTGSSTRSHPVSGYTTKKGTYVAPHRQTNPDQTRKNNYSTKGNTNPTTRKPGTKTATH